MKHLLKYALLLKLLAHTKGKDLGNTQGIKVLGNFNTFPMVQIPLKFELRAKRYAQNTNYSSNILVFFQIGYILGKIKSYGVQKELKEDSIRVSFS